MKSLLSIMSAFMIGMVLSMASGLFGININPILGGASVVTALSVAGFHSFATGQIQTGILSALQTEVWVADIMENLYLGNEFINRSIDDGAYVVNGIVHLPQAGDEPNIVKNRSVFPAPITERTDSEVTYPVANYTTDPIRVRNFDEVQLSYMKRQSVLGNHTAALSERMGDEVAHTWSPTGDAGLVFRTTGDVGADLPHAGAGGQRRALTKKDVAKMAKKLDKDKMPKIGRTLMLSPEMYYELFEIDALVRQDFMGKVALPEGAINRILGFDVIVRDTIVMYDESIAGVKKAVGAAEAATDCLGALAWSKFATRKALGSVQVYLNENQAEHFGDIMSAEVNLGSRIARADSKGIVAIAQGYQA